MDQHSAVCNALRNVTEKPRVCCILLARPRQFVHPCNLGHHSQSSLSRPSCGVRPKNTLPSPHVFPAPMQSSTLMHIWSLLTSYTKTMLYTKKIIRKQ